MSSNSVDLFWENTEDPWRGSEGRVHLLWNHTLQSPVVVLETQQLSGLDVMMLIQKILNPQISVPQVLAAGVWSQ